MKTKSLIILVIALAVLAGIIAITSRQPRSQIYESSGQPVLPRAITGQASKIQIVEKNAPNSIVLEKKDGDLWRITSYHNAPANLTRIAKLTDDLEASKIQRTVTANPERFERLGLGTRSVTFLDNQQKELYSISFGDNSPDGGYYLKIQNNEFALEAHPQVFFTTNPDEWLARELFQFKIEDITALSFQLPNETPVRFQRDDQGKWQLLKPQIPEGRNLKNDMPESLLRLILAINIFQHNLITDTQSQAAFAHSREIEFTLKDGNTVSLRIGRAPAEESPDDSTTQNSNPVLIFLQKAPETHAWSEAARTIIPHVTETLLQQIPSSIDDMLAAPTPEESAQQQPLIPPSSPE